MDLHQFLSDTPYACSDLIPLSGGVANFTCRGRLVTPPADGTETVVIKHAEPYVALNRSFKLDVARSDFEQRTLLELRSLSPLLSDAVLIKTPILHYFFKESNTLVVEDLPESTDLKTFLLSQTDSKETATYVGSALGSWTRSFHVWGLAPEQNNLRTYLKASVLATGLKWNINYGRLLETATRFPSISEEQRKVLEEVCTAMKKESSKSKGIIHGDFWPGNILLPKTLDLRRDTIDLPSKLFVIDWEFAQISSPAFDLGQMFAELFLFQHFRDDISGCTVVNSFLRTYGLVGLELAYHIAIHFGVHLIVWPCRVLGWGDQTQIEECAQIGMEYIWHAHRREKDWFQVGVLEKLFFPGGK